MPMPRAASIIVLSMLVSPVNVFFKMGSRAYSAMMTIAVLSPIPINGIKKPINARLGMACMTLAKPITGLENF